MTNASDPDPRRDAPDTDATFRDRYDRLIRALLDLVELEHDVVCEPVGTHGVRLWLPDTNREVRITAIEEQSRIHFVFGHTTLGTMHRAEHHASRPFADRAPDVPRLLFQLLDFLKQGTEPRWLTRRPGTGDRAREPGPDDELELPLL